MPNRSSLGTHVSVQHQFDETPATAPAQIDYDDADPAGRRPSRSSAAIPLALVGVALLWLHVTFDVVGARGVDGVAMRDAADLVALPDEPDLRRSYVEWGWSVCWFASIAVLATVSAPNCLVRMPVRRQVLAIGAAATGLLTVWTWSSIAWLARTADTDVLLAGAAGVLGMLLATASAIAARRRT